jgi:hypothetical protein
MRMRIHIGFVAPEICSGTRINSGRTADLACAKKAPACGMQPALAAARSRRARRGHTVRGSGAEAAPVALAAPVQAHACANTARAPRGVELTRKLIIIIRFAAAGVALHGVA